MTKESPHERARHLACAAWVEPLPDKERVWLDGHLEACAACRSESAALGAGVASVRVADTRAAATLVAATRRALEERATELDDARLRRAGLLLSCGLSALLLLTLLGLQWRLLGAGSWFHLSPLTWQVLSLWLWLWPAALVVALLALHRRLAHVSRAEWRTT